MSRSNRKPLNGKPLKQKPLKQKVVPVLAAGTTS